MGQEKIVNDTAPSELPAGYCKGLARDPALAEVRARSDYNEVVVYHNDAIRPSRLATYGIPAPWLDRSGK